MAISQKYASQDIAHGKSTFRLFEDRRYFLEDRTEREVGVRKPHSLSHREN